MAKQTLTATLSKGTNVTGRLSVGVAMNREQKIMLEEAYTHSKSPHVQNSDLDNYYKKTETYSKSEVDTKVVNEISPLADDIENSKTSYTGYKYDTLSERLNADYDDFQQRLNNATYLEYEGSNITANESYFANQKDTVVKGRTLQNLCIDYLNKEQNTFTLKDEVTMLGNDTVYNSETYRIRTLKFANDLKPNTTYTFIVNIRSLETLTNGLGNYIIDGDGTTTYSFFGLKGTGLHIKNFTTNDSGAKIIALYVEGEGTSATISSPIILEGDYTNNSIEELPFIEGIQSVGDVSENYEGYKIKGKSCGKNLAKTINSENYEILGNGKIYFGDGYCEITDMSNWGATRAISTYTIPVKNDVVYTMRIGTTSTAERKYLLMVQCFDSNDNLIEAKGLVKIGRITPPNYDAPRITYYKGYQNDVENGFYYQFKAPICKIKLMFSPKHSNGTITDKFFNPIMYEGVHDIVYEPYQETPYEYILNEPLRELPNGVCDELDMNKGVVRRKVGKYTFKGTEAFAIGSEVTGDVICVYFSYKALLGYDLLSKNNILCNTLPVYDYNNNYTDTQLILSSEFCPIISIKKGNLKSADIDGVRQWLKDNPTTIYYALPEPYEEQVDIKYLKSFDKQTHIMSDNKIIPYVKTKIPSNVEAVVSNLIEENNELINSNTEIKASAERIVAENAKRQQLIEDLNAVTEFLISESLM